MYSLVIRPENEIIDVKKSPAACCHKCAQRVARNRIKLFDRAVDTRACVQLAVRTKAQGLAAYPKLLGRQGSPSRRQSLSSAV